MSLVRPFRMTAEDLGDLDSKTRNGLQPLLEALNETLQQLVTAAEQTPTIDVVPVTLVTQATVADSFPLLFRSAVTRPRWVGLVCNPQSASHSLASPFSMQGFSITAKGLISVPFITGLLPNQTYALAFLIR